MDSSIAQSKDVDNNNTDIVISVDQSSHNNDVIIPTSPPLFPQGQDPFENTNTHAAGIQIGGETNNINDEILRSISSPVRPDPNSGFRYPGHFLRGDYTPSVLSAHQQSIRPYSPSFRNDHPSLGGHRFLDGHHMNLSDAGRLLVIDYAGLDSSIIEATLLENGIQKTMFVDPPSNPENEKKERNENLKESKKSLERTSSIGSSVQLGPASIASGNTAFKRRSARKASFYSERAPRPPLPESLRYTFYSKSTGLVQAPSMSTIVSSATIKTDNGPRTPSVFSELLKDGCYWLDILDPSDFDMQILSEYFHVHPLTIEDISTEEVREKYEVFRHYYFVCFRTIDQDFSSGSYFQPASMYSVVFKDGLITFHFRPTNHHLNVLRRIERLQSQITLNPDWINYALLDDITDSFAPPILTIQDEVDCIDELVLLLRENETTDMLRRIGSCRKNVMTLSRLLSNKADVVRGLMKRFDERYTVASVIGVNPPAVSNIGVNSTTAAPGASGFKVEEGINAGGIIHTQHHRDGEIMLYLGDILDHVLTMLQSLWGYDKILDRSHSNYLAQISLEINQLSNKTNDVVGRLTFFASLIVPMTFITGLWGMNIHVPGQGEAEEGETLYWWWAMIGFMAIYCVVAIFFGKRYELI
ncbi:CorA metal ion transporter [Entomortierella beljakovae]|nr:CorA metal ion transporter [Entomortierella beljakovae]